MAVLESRALLDTQRAFDGVAADYDRSNTENQLLCAMRERVRRTIERHTQPGGHLLDLGCGPGADAEHFANAGYRITAIDWSPRMVAETDRRVRRGGLGDRVTVRHLGIQDIDALSPATFDAAYSNFGPLNCVPDLAAAARLVAARLRPNGVLVASVIGRVCPWELALYLGRGDWNRARVRFARGRVPVPLAGETVWTQYYSPTAFEHACGGAGFSRLYLRALGLFTPPPYLQAFADRHPALVSTLERADDWLGAAPGLRNAGDHFLIVLRKTSVSGQRAKG